MVEGGGYVRFWRCFHFVDVCSRLYEEERKETRNYIKDKIE